MKGKNPIYAKLKKAAIEVQVQEIAALDKKMAFAEPHIFSEEFKLKMEKLIGRSKKPYFPYTNTFGKRVTIITIILLTFLAPALSVEAVRRPFYNFVITVYDKFTSIIFQEDTDLNSPTTLDKIFEPEFVPEGYTLLEKIDLVLAIQIIYANEDGNEIIFEQYVASAGKLGIDTEGGSMEEFQLEGNEFLFVSNKNYNQLIWIDNGYGYHISGPIDKETMITMAQSIKVKK